MDGPLIEVAPHPEALHIIVRKSALDERAARQLETEVSQAAAGRSGPVILDMAKVRFAPSVALGALAQLWKGLNMVGRPLALINVNRQIRDILSVTKLDSLMGIYASVDEALPRLKK